VNWNLDKTDAVLYYSSASLSTGGAISGTKIQNKQVQNFFKSIGLAEAVLGSTTYLGFYVKNDSATETGLNFTIFVDPNTPHETDEITIGADPAGLNGVMQTIATITTDPVGVSFELAPTYNQGIFVGTLKPGEYFPLWLKRIITPTRVEQKHNNFFVNIGFDPTAGSGSGGSGSGSGGGGSGGGTGGGGTPGPAPGDIDIAVDSDWGTSSGTQATIDNINSFPTIKYLLIAGDISYQSKGDKWRDMTAKIRDGGVITRFAPGNHDYEDGSGLISFYTSLFSQGKTYSSTTIGNILVITGDVYTSFSTSSDQYKFIKGELEKAKNNSSILWKIVLYHEPIFGSKSQHSNNSKWRDTFMPLFTANKVDLAINGHNHHYERTFPLTWNSGSPSKPNQVNTGQDPNYTDPGGTICLTVGTGGHDIQYKIDSDSAWQAFAQDSYFGFLMISLGNGGKTLTGKFYKNSGHTLTDTWSITKA